ncbi:hypothetical protein BUALT_Bualt06G0012400 [Buddleja alternifolia]|uniref:Transposase n=1 Tax=Buddleja alternifolia TaxID=168488 RepID=A0AAV6XD60_9LAMI|nr:hypothetical protein BUALT_Bualt06G0012400 [Buddleja alternifolia]
MHDLISYNDETCINNLQMSRNAFGRLCFILENVGGLSPTKNVLVSEQVAIFLSVLAHHTKNRIVKHHFKRSGYTISTHFNNVLTALLMLPTLFLVKPVPIEADCRNKRWKRFKGCLGALDGTYIPLRVAQKNKARYRNRKGDVSTNVLAVCDINMNYTHLLCGWEGSAADSRVLKDAINRENGLRVPQGNYYLCDSGYTNGEGFLAPYRGVRYHIQEWNAQRTPPPPNKMPMNYSIRMRGGATKENSGKSSRRAWTVDEEFALANALKDLLVKGWKADNGFKTGYQGLLEHAMIQAFPGTNIRVDPHINSRIHVWRKNYGSISTMLSRSGFGWNDTTHTIVVDSDAVWHNYIKTDNNARMMRYKSWPLYRDWEEIFGNDRATGENAERFADVVQNLLNNNGVDPVNNNEAGGDKSNSKGKRKLVDETDDCFMNLMTAFCEKTDERLGDISKRIGFEHDASLSRKAVYKALGEVASLDSEDMILVSHLIVNNTKNMDLFFSLPTDGKKTMVRMIVEGKFPGNNNIG